MTPPVEPTAAERDPKRVQDARLWELLHPEQKVEWLGCRRNTRGDWQVEGLTAEWPGTEMQPCRADEQALFGWTLLPFYSSDGNAMLAVIEAMETKRLFATMGGWGKHWLVQFTDGPEGRVVAENWATTAPEAVVAAAIAALESEAGR